MPDLITHLEITALTHGGRGIGRHEGKAVFVPLTMPGDLVSCHVVKSKKRFVEAELCELRNPSPLRRKPPCPYFGACGGCQWQHMPYPEQVKYKQQIFADLILRNKLTSADRIKPIVAAPDEWHYRNRVQLKCHLTEQGLVVGFYRHGSHFVVDVESCMLVAPELQQVIELLRIALQSAPCRECIPQVDLACGDDGAVRMILHTLPDGRDPLRQWLRAFAGRHQLNACLQAGRKDTVELVYGQANLAVTVDDPVLHLEYGPGGFVQVNSAQNRNMVDTMVELAALDGTETVLDLFCGMGNFSLPLARRAGRVIGVEDYEPSIASARINALLNKVDNVEFHAADAFAVMEDLGKREVPDLVVLDPPRTGHYTVARELQKLRPEKILYISCDPATLARDLTPLVHDGYEVVSSQPFDLFPQTWHIESMTMLNRL